MADGHRSLEGQDRVPTSLLMPNFLNLFTFGLCEFGYLPNFSALPL